MIYRISEAQDGRFVVDREAGSGLWLILVGPDRDCRSATKCYEAIAADWLNGDMSREVAVQAFFQNDPDNPLRPDVVSRERFRVRLVEARDVARRQYEKATLADLPAHYWRGVIAGMSKALDLLELDNQPNERA